MAEPSIYVLDSFALLAYLEGEKGALRVSELLSAAQQGQCRLLLSLINLGEIVYITERERGLLFAHQVLAAVEQLPIQVLPVDREATLAMAHIKAQHPLSLADAFAVAAAQLTGGIVVTGDPEFAEVQSIVNVEWLAR